MAIIHTIVFFKKKAVSNNFCQKLQGILSIVMDWSFELMMDIYHNVSEYFLDSSRLPSTGQFKSCCAHTLHCAALTNLCYIVLTNLNQTMPTRFSQFQKCRPFCPALSRTVGEMLKQLSTKRSFKATYLNCSNFLSPWGVALVQSSRLGSYFENVYGHIVFFYFFGN